MTKKFKKLYPLPRMLSVIAPKLRNKSGLLAVVLAPPVNPCWLLNAKYNTFQEMKINITTPKATFLPFRLNLL